MTSENWFDFLDFLFKMVKNPFSRREIVGLFDPPEEPYDMAALGIARGARSWGRGLGLVVAGGAFLGYLASRTIGMPGLPAEPDAWFESLGITSFVAEGAFVLLAL